MFLTYLNADAADLAVQIRLDATLTQCFPTLNRFIVDCLSGVKKACEYEYRVDIVPAASFGSSPPGPNGGEPGSD